MARKINGMPVDRAAFFADVRQSLFRGRLSQSQVDGLENLLDVWERDYSQHDLRWLAYCLATAFHETAHTMRPVEEFGRGRGRRYARRDAVTGKAYYGRGHVQLTWGANYRRAGERIGVDLYNRPELALREDISARILYSGCIEGWFTGRKLADYIGGRRRDYRGARRIVNGTDRAELIAGQAKAFEAALRNRHTERNGQLANPVSAGPTGKPSHKSTTNWGALVSMLAGTMTACAAAVKDVADSLGRSGVVIIALLGVAAAIYIVRERQKKSYLEGV
jgi:predicted chitinase